MKRSGPRKRKVMNESARLAASQNLWNLYRSIFARRGLDVEARSNRWSEEKRKGLARFSAETSFDELRESGCSALPLAIAIAMVQPLRSFEKKWAKITGTARERDQKIRAIEKAANVLEDLLGSVADVLIADACGALDTTGLKELRKDIIAPNAIYRGTIDVPDPSTTIHALRTYVSVLTMLESIRKESGVASSGMLSKYFYRLTCTGQRVDFTTRKYRL